MSSLAAAGPARRVCENHRERPAHAVCMGCRKAVCSECVAEWDGVNYCVACLAGKRRGVRRGSALPGWLGLAVAGPVLLWLSARLMVWIGVLLAGEW